MIWPFSLFFKKEEPKTLAEAVAETAETKIGVREEGGANKGADLQPFFESDWYKPNAADDGYAWCASFVCWVIQVAAAGREKEFELPTTPRAWEFEDWGRGQGSAVDVAKPAHSDIKRGDIVVFRISHIGVAVSSVDTKGYFYAVEGNTNSSGGREGDGVYCKKRHISQIRSRIRFQS